MTEKVKTAAGYFAELFRLHPALTLVLLGLAGGGWYFDRHPEMFVALTSSGLFSAIPNGWIGIAVLAQAVGLFSLSRQISGCERECAVQAALYEADLRTLRTCIGRLILLVADDRREEAARVMQDADDEMSLNHGHAPRHMQQPHRRWYDEQHPS